MTRGEEPSTAAACREHLARSPQDHEVRLRLARLVGARRPEGDEFRDEAIAECRLILAAAPPAPPGVASQAAFLLGSLLDDLAPRYGEAVEAYEQGLALDGSSVVGHNNLGAVLCELGRFDEAEDHFLGAAALRPGYGTVMRNLAKMYFRWVGEERLVDVVGRLVAQGGPAAATTLHGLMVALVEFARRDAFEDFYSRGHRLKNVLAILGSRAKRLQRRLVDPDAAAELGSVVAALGEAAAELRGYLSLIRPREAEFTAVDPGALVARVVERVAAGAPSGVIVEAGPPAVLPCLRADRALLGEAVANLLANALDAVGEHGRVRAEAVDRPERAEVAIVVDDTGPGLPATLRREVFRPGFTLKPGGSGLGLAIVQRTVQDLGGRARVEDSPLGGARFVLELPVAEGEGAVAGRGLGERPVGLDDTTRLLAEELTD